MCRCSSSATAFMRLDLLVPTIRCAYSRLGYISEGNKKSLPGVLLGRSKIQGLISRIGP
jgi:hypothetical protein